MTTTPESHPTPDADAGAPAPARRGSALWPALAALFAITTLVLAVVLLWPGAAEEADEGLTGTAAASAALACQIMAEVDPAGHEDAGTDEAWADLNRLSAAESLGHTAEAQDPSYEDLRTTLGTPRLVQAQAFSMDVPDYTEAVERAQRACEDVLVGED